MSPRNPETEIGGSQNAFQSTYWTLVLQAQDAASPARRDALQTLIQTYWKPLYWFVRRKGQDPEAAKDLVQGFFAALLEKDYLRYVDRDRGRFRTFLLTALEHYVSDERDRASALKRGGGRTVFPLDFDMAECAVSVQRDVDPELAFRREWWSKVLEQAMDRVRASFGEKGRSEEFEAYRAYLSSMHPADTSYEEIARRIGVSSETVKNRVRSARADYREAILQVIREYAGSEEEARAELDDLFRAFR